MFHVKHIAINCDDRSVRWITVFIYTPGAATLEGHDSTDCRRLTRRTTVACFERPFKSLDQLHETELDYLKRMIESGVVIAIPTAKHYCVAHGIDVPIWLTRISIELECASLRRDRRKRRGRTANPIARHRQDMRHFDRWSAVCEVREKQDEIRVENEKLRKLPNVPPHLLKEREEMLNRVGSTLEDACRCASDLLAKKESFGCPETMKASYLRVERESRDPKKAMCYHLLDPQFIRKIY
jgi:hypothetical protein